MFMLKCPSLFSHEIETIPCLVGTAPFDGIRHHIIVDFLRYIIETVLSVVAHKGYRVLTLVIYKCFEFKFFIIQLFLSLQKIKESHKITSVVIIH